MRRVVSEKVGMVMKSVGVDENNSITEALCEVQQAFEGIADELGIKTEKDVVDMVKEIRSERYAEQGQKYKIL